MNETNTTANATLTELNTLATATATFEIATATTNTLGAITQQISATANNDNCFSNVKVEKYSGDYITDLNVKTADHGMNC
jgi:hypothetical protein